jgi:hypothetical protein
VVVDARFGTPVAGSWALKGPAEEPLDDGAFNHWCARAPVRGPAAAPIGFLRSLVGLRCGAVEAESEE